MLTAKGFGLMSGNGALLRDGRAGAFGLLHPLRVAARMAGLRVLAGV